MIDEKINNSIKELEQSLKNLESAREQVEKTVNAYDGLNSSTTEYVNKLGIITTKIQALVNSIGTDYTLKIKDFEKDRETIINASNTAIEKLSNTIENFKMFQTKLKYYLIADMVLFVAIGVILYLLLK